MASPVIIAGWLPVWVVESILPVTFAVIALRFVTKVKGVSARLLAFLGIPGAAVVGFLLAPYSSQLLWPGIAGLFVTAILGAPIFVLLGGTALLLFFADASPVAAIPVETYRLVVSPSIPAIPLFTLAGYILAESGASRRLVHLFRALFGWLPGGLAVVVTLVCAFFTTFTGASGVTILALGGLLLPVLLENGYKDRFSVGLLTSTGSLGLLFPPSLAVILYGVVAHVSILDLFKAGIIPGFLLVAAVSILGIREGVRLPGPRPSFDAREAGAAIWESKWELLIPVIVLGGRRTAVAHGVVAHVSILDLFKAGIIPGFLLVAAVSILGIREGVRLPGPRPSFDAREAGAAIWESKWELLIPVIVLGGLFGGLCTLIEAAAITVVYSLFVEMVIHRELHPTRNLPTVLIKCLALIGGVFAILGVAMGLTNYLVDAEVPMKAAEWFKTNMHSRTLFLLGLNLFLLLVGCLLDIFSAIAIVVPLILPISKVFGIDPLHLGMIFLINLQLGYLTPPVGLNLFFASFRFERPLAEICRDVIPFFLIIVVVLLLITYVPILSLMCV